MLALPRGSSALLFALPVVLASCSSDDTPEEKASGGAAGAAAGVAGSAGAAQSGGSSGSGQSGGGVGPAGGASGAGSGGTPAGSGGSVEAGTAGSAQAGSGALSGSGGAAPVSYRATIAPIFESSCVLCHYTGSLVIDIANPFAPETGLVASANTWAAAHPEANLPARNVQPGDPENSFVMMKIADPDLDPATSGEPMPWQVPRVTDAQVTALRDWISAGAANDATFESTIRPIFGAEGSFSGKCVHCHWSNGERPNLQNPFDPATGAVGVMNSLETQNIIEPGNPDESFLITKVTSMSLPPGQGRPMPAHFPRLTTEEVEAIRTWIAEGALDN